jgi:hypothetical protein
LHGYPASGLVYPEQTSAEHLWSDIAKLQQHGVPLNLINIGSRTYLIPRNINHEVVQEFPSGILASMELLGVAITTERSFFQQADWPTIQTALQKSTLEIQEVLGILAS